MSAINSIAPSRGKYQGMLQILRYNWPFYVFAALVSAVGIIILFALDLSSLWRALLIVGLLPAIFWSCSSLLASHYVYDLSRLSRWQWIAENLPARLQSWVSVHAGLDEVSPSLRRMFPRATGVVLDCFNEREMTEPSIARARRSSMMPAAAARAQVDALPLANNSCEAALVIFAAHEIRRPQARVRFFRELNRVLSAGARLVVTEHLRDFNNFVVYGPGFLHFLSAREWRRVARAADFQIEREIKITPFVRVFVWRKRT